MTTTDTPRERWGLRPKEAADILGIDLSTYYRRVHPYVLSGDIRSRKIGRARRVDYASLREWWDNGDSREA